MSGIEFPYIFIGIENTPVALTKKQKLESDTTCVEEKNKKEKKMKKTANTMDRRGGSGASVR